MKETRVCFIYFNWFINKLENKRKSKPPSSEEYSLGGILGGSGTYPSSNPLPFPPHFLGRVTIMSSTSWYDVDCFEKQSIKIPPFPLPSHSLPIGEGYRVSGRTSSNTLGWREGYSFFLILLKFISLIFIFMVLMVLSWIVSRRPTHPYYLSNFNLFIIFYTKL